MRVLITAGGTTEKIDEVRGITNHSTGKLGCEIAHGFLQGNCFIDYVTTPQAVLPKAQPEIEFHFIQETIELSDKLTELLTANSYDAVIHSMAVSDFTPTEIFDQEAFITAVNQLLPHYDNRVSPEFFNELSPFKQTGKKKISSNTDTLFLVLKKNPKVIQLIKQLQPETILVGFKLLVDVSSEELLTVAQNSLSASKSDYILANDLTSISDSRHCGYLLDKKGVVGVGKSKKEIAKLIVQTILANYQQGGQL